MIDLRNKCGSCSHFKLIDGTCNGECLRNPYGANIVHDPKHPYCIVARSRMKCKDYNRPPMTNADRIRAISDEELAKLLVYPTYEYTVDYDYDENPIGDYTSCWATSDGSIFCDRANAVEFELAWLKQPYVKEDTQ